MRGGRRVLLLALVAAVGCNREDERPTPAAPNPEQPQRFLLEPAGVAPDPLVPAHVGLRLTAAEDVAAARTRIAALAGDAVIWPPADRSEVTAFLERHRLWYADLDALRRYRAARDRGDNTDPPPAVEPGGDLDRALCVLRKPAAIRREQLLALRAAKGRGSLVYWYPVMEVRQRLIDGGLAGLWHGILRVRDDVPGTGRLLGGTPRLWMAAVAAIDLPALGKPLSPAFKSALTEDVFLGPTANRPLRAELLRALKAPPPPVAATLPAAWRDYFRAPDGTRLAYLVPARHNVMDGALDPVVEALAGLVKQGGVAWVLIELPLVPGEDPDAPAKPHR